MGETQWTEKGLVAAVEEEGWTFVVDGMNQLAEARLSLEDADNLLTQATKLIDGSDVDVDESDFWTSNVNSWRVLRHRSQG